MPVYVGFIWYKVFFTLQSVISPSSPYWKNIALRYVKEAILN